MVEVGGGAKSTSPVALDAILGFKGNLRNNSRTLLVRKMRELETYSSPLWELSTAAPHLQGWGARTSDISRVC